MYIAAPRSAPFRQDGASVTGESTLERVAFLVPAEIFFAYCRPQELQLFFSFCRSLLLAFQVLRHRGNRGGDSSVVEHQVSDRKIAALGSFSKLAMRRNIFCLCLSKRQKTRNSH